jgi:molecular chaperone DnaK
MSQNAGRSTESPLDRITPPSPATRSSGPVIGIDVGTTWCRVGVTRNGESKLVQEGPRSAAIPAFIGVSPQGRILVGQPAQRQLASAPENTVFGIKRLLAPYRSAEARSLRQQLRCQIFGGQDERSWVRFGDRAFSPRELLAMLLAQARDLAQNYLGQPVHRAVVGVSPEWDETLRGELVEAVKLAGMHAVGLMPDPVAVAWAQKREGDAPARTSLVFDWGGGHFRASLLIDEGQGLELVGSATDPLLGGAELDRHLLQQLLAPLPERTVLLSDENAAATSRVADAVERAKISLSDRAETRVRVPFVLPDPSGQLRDLDLPLTRARLEAVAQPFIDRALSLCRKLLDDQGVYIFDVDEVLLAGGQSRMPRVRARLAELLPNVPVRADAPEEAIALGVTLASARM